MLLYLSISKRSFFVLSTIFLLYSCNPNKEQTTIIQDRQAATDLDKSMSVDQSKMTLTLKKESLKKAFILIPQVIKSERTPVYADYKPQIVSFEKAGSRIGLFKLSASNLYDVIPTDQLIQSFQIIKETADDIVIDISRGFRSIELATHLTIVDKAIVEQNQYLQSSGLEKTIELKDVLVRKVEQDDNALFIEQSVRIKNLKNPKTFKSVLTGSAESFDDPENTESTATIRMEMRPYLFNSRFKSKLFDIKQRVGFFNNFTFEKGGEILLPQITKWDLSEEAGSIDVLFDENIPTEIVSALEDGVMYWNRVIQKDIFKIKKGFKNTERLKNRSIAVRWLPWDSAGFAYASFQADPMTGEIFRGQIFMTSSWYKSTRDAVSLPVSNEVQHEVNQLCHFSNLEMLRDLNSLSLTSEKKSQFVNDTLRIVLAHELGHVLGLRHNFAASFDHKGADSEIVAAENKYLNTHNDGGYSFTTSIMDYERGVHTALLGAYIKSNVLSYDQLAIDWAYKNKDIESSQLKYCSDEHIIIAHDKKTEVYGCQRFDGYKNILLGQIQSVRSSILMSTYNSLNMLQYILLGSSNPYALQRKLDDMISFSTNINFDLINKILFVDSANESLMSIENVISYYQANLASLAQSYVGTPYSDGSLISKLTQDFNEVKDISSLIRMMLPGDLLAHPSTFFKSQIELFFNELEPTALVGLTPIDIEKIKNKYIEQTADSSVRVIIHLMENFIPKKANNQAYRSFVKIGDAEFVFELFKRAFMGRQSKVRVVQVGQQQISLQMTSDLEYKREQLKNAFLLSNWPWFMQADVGTALSYHLTDLKKELAKNTLLILEANGLPYTGEISYARLTSALNQLNWSQISGLSNYELASEVKAIETLENLK